MIARLVIALVLSLALAAPAFAQNDKSARIDQDGGSSQIRVLQQGDEGSNVSAQQEDGGRDVSASQSGNCNPNYEGECLDQPGDYDCPSRAGDGPNFTQGEVRVVGQDEYELDRDGDGIGCNDQGGGRRFDHGGDHGSTPRGGVDSGLGGTAPRLAAASGGSGVCKPLAAGGGLLMLLGAGGLVVTLRRRV